MRVLIVTHSNDWECTPLVVDALERRGVSAVCLNTDLFPSKERLVLGHSQNGLRQQLLEANGCHDLDDLEAIWVRRLRVAEGLPPDLPTDLRGPSVDEARRTLFGFLFTSSAFLLDPFENVQHAENKMLQLALAREVGLEVPPTLLSNDAEGVRRFARMLERPLITKMQSSFRVVREGTEQVVFTNVLDEDSLDSLDEGLSLCPMMFQAEIPKRMELRLTVVGREIISASVDSQSSERALDDWRRDGVALADRWQPYRLPEEIAGKIGRLMDRLGLNYGAVDMIVTPEGRHVFIEVNPVGEWFWLDRHCGFQIAEALADVLIGKAPRRETDRYRRQRGARS